MVFGERGKKDIYFRGTKVKSQNFEENRETNTVKPVLSGHSKRSPKIGFKYRLSLNAGQKYCRMF